MKGANRISVSSFNLALTSPWPRNITLRETPALRVICPLCHSITLRAQRKSVFTNQCLLSLWIELRFCMHQDMISVAAGKILPAKTINFFHGKITFFFRILRHSLRSTCHATCPLPQSARNQYSCAKIHTMLTLVHHGETLCPLQLVAQPMHRAEVLHAPRYDINDNWKNTPGENELVIL